MSNEISTSKIVDGYKKAFVDASILSDPDYSPELVINSKGNKVLSVLEKEFRNCSDLFISVAFITRGGIAPLLGTLKELEEKNVHGRILTTDYLLFSDPKALDTLESLSNLEVRLFKTAENKVGFHTKGYMFHNGDSLRIIIGSSNLTQAAITENHEWNTRLISSTEGQFAKSVEAEFNELWNSSVSYSEYRDEYSRLYNESEEKKKELEKLKMTLDLNYSQVLEPNSMQEQFTANIEAIVNNNGHKALLISATGTGKTFASAFAIRKLFSDDTFNNKKTLFLSHREQINIQAFKSYKRVFGKGTPMGFLSGSFNDSKEAIDAKGTYFLFSTMNMMAKPEVREEFSPEEFSVIIVDECHRIGATSYQNIIDYFKPELLLGMSASPERTDGFDVYSQFDHNIACEIRLQQALENDLLCPFHYYGITDLEVNDKSSDVSNFRLLTSDKRVRHIIQQAKYYGFSGKRVKGLVFCSTKKEAEVLSSKFNAIGKYRTLMLSGDNSQEERLSAIERLVSDTREDRIDYIFTVDIFNEGVDIPEINQVILLRPTESPIVFVQQLGRGLRISEDKEFVIILDFIGNYQNNYMIPIALTGDRSGNKDNIRKGLMDGNNLIHGASTIYFDEISRKRIYQSIDGANLNGKKTLREEYAKFKFKIGRIPLLKEFDDKGELDPLRIISVWGSYQAFLLDSDEDFSEKYTNNQLRILEFISRKFASGLRPHEISLLKILVNEPGMANLWKDSVYKKYGVLIDEKAEDCVRKVLTGTFFKSQYYDFALIDYKGKNYSLSKVFVKAIADETFKKAVNELLDFCIYRYEKDHLNSYTGTAFCLYKKYTYSDVCWLLNWEKDFNAQAIGGYKYNASTNTFPIFINYEKKDVDASINYEDRFYDNRKNLIAISKQPRTLKSPDVQKFINSKENGTLVPLFVRKNKDDKTSQEFYFLGTLDYAGNLGEFVMPNTANKTAVKILWELKVPIEKQLFEYLTEASL